MTKNSGQKKAARKYQQHHPGTTLPEAMRAVARPSAEPFSMPDGYVLLDQEGMPTTFDPGEATAAVLMESAGASAVPTLSDKEAAARSVAMIESLLESLGERLDAQDRGMLRRATSAVRAEGPQDNGHRWGKSTLNPEYRSLLFRDINNNGPVRLPVSLPTGAIAPESTKGLPAVAAAHEPIPHECRTDEPDLTGTSRQSESTSAPESRESEPQNAGAVIAALPGEEAFNRIRAKYPFLEFTDAERQSARSWFDREDPGAPGPE